MHMAKVIGVGGVFFKAGDPDSLGAWYKEWLGVPVEPPYGASFKPEDLPAGGLTVWAPFNVDDLNAALEQVREGGATVVGDVEEYDYGRFGWFMDPEGNKVELWEPRKLEPERE
jgi:hypothetical protein